MTTPNPVLSEMINDAPVQAAAADEQITQLDDTIEELTEKRNAIRDNVCGAMADDLETYLEGPKLLAIQADYPSSPTLSDVYIVYNTVIGEGTYGSIDYETGNITNWQFLQDILPVPIPPDPPIDPLVRYEYTPGDDPTIEDFKTDFDFGNDYITRPLDSGASYGLNPLISAYGSGKSIVSANKTKVEASIDVFERHL